MKRNSKARDIVFSALKMDFENRKEAWKYAQKNMGLGIAYRTFNTIAKEISGEVRLKMLEKNYITDRIDKGLINSGNLNKDIKEGILSIQSLLQQPQRLDPWKTY